MFPRAMNAREIDSTRFLFRKVPTRTLPEMLRAMRAGRTGDPLTMDACDILAGEMLRRRNVAHHIGA